MTATVALASSGRVFSRARGDKTGLLAGCRDQRTDLHLDHLRRGPWGSWRAAEQFLGLTAAHRHRRCNQAADC